MSDYSVSDAEFRELTDLIAQGRMQEARECLDALLEDHVDDACADLRNAMEDEPGDPDLERAKEEIRGGRPREGLVWLERFLGPEFIGLLTGDCA